MNFTDKEMMNLKYKVSPAIDNEKSQKKIIKLDKTSILNTSQSGFIPKTNTQKSDPNAKVLTLVKKQFINNTIQAMSNTTNKNNASVPANNITNTIFNNPVNSSGGKPILVIKQLSDMTATLTSSKPENSHKNLPAAPIKKSKPKNSGHIKTLLSQSEQNMPLKQQQQIIPPAIFAIAKKAPSVKILKTQPVIAKPIPQVAVLVDDSSLIELSVQEVTVQSTDPEPADTQTVTTSYSEPNLTIKKDSEEPESLECSSLELQEEITVQRDPSPISNT